MDDIKDIEPGHIVTLEEDTAEQPGPNATDGHGYIKRGGLGATFFEGTKATVLGVFNANEPQGDVRVKVAIHGRWAYVDGSTPVTQVTNY